jgi:Spy/CpxP family protein refolding chaperone
MSVIKSFVAGAMVLGLGVGAVVAETPAARHHRGFSEGPPPLRLLAQKSVRDELKLTEDQQNQLREALHKEREAVHRIMDLAREDRDKQFPDLYRQDQATATQLLSAEQSRRLKQITWQWMGARAVLVPEVSKTLGITDEQRAKIQAIQKETWQEARKTFAEGNGPSEENKAKFRELRKAADSKAMSVLTGDQTASLNALLGEPFHGELHLWHHRH